MSLHIESTENALAELKKQRTKTLTAAISVSFLGIALMGLLLYLVHIIVAVPEDPPMVAYATQEGDNPDIDTPEVTQTTQRPSSSSTSAQVKVIAAVATAAAGATSRWSTRILRWTSPRKNSPWASTSATASAPARATETGEAFPASSPSAAI